MIRVVFLALALALASRSAALAPAPREADEFRERLAQLSSPRAAERAAAERWLEAHLERERYPDLAETALAGDAEVRGRLVHVLSSDGRHLGLALELCTEKDPGLAALGRAAVRAGVARFDPRLGEPAVRDRTELELVLREVASKSPPRYLRVDGRLPLEGLCAQLDLVGELPLGLTLDAPVATRVIRREEELASGPWDELLLRVARTLNVGIECHGIVPGREREVPEDAFLCLASEQDPPRTGAERISEWLIVVATDRNEAARTRAARNLGSCGFPPGIEWMDQLVASRGDVAAREGLLRAAARGRVARSLLSPPVFDALLAEAESGSDSTRILCALARVGCLDARGAPLARHLFPEPARAFAEGSPRARWTRLFFLEQGGCALPAAVPAARALFTDPETPPALRLRALYWLGLSGAGAPVEPRSLELGSEHLAELFRMGLDRVEIERLGRVLALLEIAPPHRDPSAISADWSARERLDLLQAWLWRGEAEPVAAHIGAVLTVDVLTAEGLRAEGPSSEAPSADAETRRAEELADELRPWLARGERRELVAALDSAQSRQARLAATLDRVRLLLGLVPAASVQEKLAAHRFVLQSATADPAPPGVDPSARGVDLALRGVDLALLGALAGYPEPLAMEKAAREQLSEALTLALRENRPIETSRDLVRALERAIGGLYAAGRDVEGDGLVNTVAHLARRSPKTALGRYFSAPLWPPAPGSMTRDLSRELARFQVPSF